jgi:hypothetical protein
VLTNRYAAEEIAGEEYITANRALDTNSSDSRREEAGAASIRQN